MIPEPQLVHWAVDDGKPPGICVDNPAEDFVSWTELELEIEERLLPQAVRVVPLGSSVKLGTFHGIVNHHIRLINPAGDPIGYVWFGKNPDKGWAYDGLVRIGDAPSDHEAVVWQLFQRYSDGTYRRIRAYDGPRERSRRVGFV